MRPRLPESDDLAAGFPRLRYMGSKYRLVPHLADVFRSVGGATALDAFSGSGVVAYALKGLGYQVTANDFLAFPSVIAGATVANQRVRLTETDVARITGPPADERDFIQRTFAGLYFVDEDHAFLDSAWSHIDQMRGSKRDLAISALLLAAAKEQPRGVFTFTDRRYDDGRRDLHISLRQQFIEAVAAYNAVVFDSGQRCRALTRNVFNRFVAFSTRHGVSLLGSRVLAVKGRTSGEWRTTPVNLLELDGQRYLVSARGEGQWVRNLRVSSTGELRVGRRTEAFRGRELSNEEKVPVLRAYLKRWKMELGVFFDGVSAESTDEELLAIAPRHPAFEVLPAAAG